MMGNYNILDAVIKEARSQMTAPISPQASDAPGPGDSRSRARLGLWAGLAIAVIVIARYLGAVELLRATLEWTKSLGPLGPIVFIAIYVAACVFFIPGSILTIGAGAVFGVVRGSIYVSIAATLGAIASLIVGRSLARDWVSSRLEGNQKSKAIDLAVGKEGCKIVLLTRLSPVFPF